jgi:hypothetical protein
VTRQHPEQQIQRAVFEHLGKRGIHGLVAIHYPAGGYRRPVEAKILRGLGVRAGVPDVLIWAPPSRAFAMELKSETGELSAAQRAMLDALAKAGVTVATCYGLDQALDTLQGWGLLIGRVQ